MIVDRRAADATPQHNGRKVTTMLRRRGGQAALFRTTVAGPSGQRRDECVAVVRYVDNGDAHEFQIHDPRDGLTIGYAGRTGSDKGAWTFWTEDADGAIWLAGWADSLSVGCDVLVHGEHSARGRHDAQRISRGSWHRHLPVPVG